MSKQSSITSVRAMRRLKTSVSTLGLILVLAVSANAAPTTFVYDELGHVTSVVHSDGSTNAYRYDSAGNRIQANRNTTNVNPVPVNDSVTVNYQTPLTFDPRSNDDDANGDILTITDTSGASHGTVSFTGASVTYTPVAGYSGSDSFTYSVSDGHGGSGSATVSTAVTIAPPVPINDTISTSTLAGVTFDPRSNDSDPHGLAFTVTGVGAPSHGTASFTGTSVSYVPTAGYVGTDSFGYTVTNSGGGWASGTVSVNVNNTPPTANDDTGTVAYGGSLWFDPRSNDTDPNGDALTITSISTPGHGQVFVDMSRNYNPAYYIPTYTPNQPAFTGQDSFTYTISDGHGGTSTATVRITLQNATPRAEPDSVSTPYLTPLTFDPRSNDYDPNNDPFVITGVGNAAHGSTSYSSSGVTYTPVAGFSGTDSFTYTINDNMGGTDNLMTTGTITVTVGDGAPVANADSVSTASGTAVTIDPRVNDTDPNGDALTVIGFGAGAANGDLSHTSTTVTYTPYPGFRGNDSFGYVISDGHGGTATGTVSVAVANGVPVAHNDNVTAGYGIAVNFDPKSNDTDPNGDFLTITSASGASHGSVSTNGSTITYTPASGYSGSDSFSYWISDGHGGTATANVSVTVQSNPVATIYVYGGNLRTLANAQGYNGASGASFDFIVPEGTEIDSTVDTGSWPSNVTLHLIVNGTVYGQGGAGGNGSCAGGSGGDGSAGDPGIDVHAPITITVNGTVLGGGGGGGGANTYLDAGQFTECGGGGGGGSPNGSGGAPDGSTGSGGMGDDYYGATRGGDGGAPGQAGNGSAGWAGGGSGGAAGASVRSNGYSVTINGSGTH